MTALRRRAVAIGEAMVEMAPVGGGLYRRGFAGDTFNTAWHMAQVLGDAAEVGFVTRVGQDSLSEAFLAEAMADGLDTTGIGRDPLRTMGLYLIELDGVERRFHYWRRDSAARGLADDPALLASALSETSLVFLSGITTAILTKEARATLLAALAKARMAGALVAFDPNVRPRLWSSPDEIRETVSRFMAVTDIALPSFDDEAQTWGDASPAATVERYVLAGVREIVVKDGPREVHVRDGQGNHRFATPPVADIRDTTGAGDAFNAGFLAGRLSGEDTQTAVGLGQRLSAEVIRTYGARADRERARGLFSSLGRVSGEATHEGSGR